MREMPDADAFCIRFDGILYEIGKHLPKFVPIGMDDDVCGNLYVPADMGIGVERALQKAARLMSSITGSGNRVSFR